MLSARRDRPIAFAGTFCPPEGRTRHVVYSALPAASSRDNIFRSPGRRGLPAHCTRHTFLSTPPAAEQFFYCVRFEAFRGCSPPPKQRICHCGAPRHLRPVCDLAPLDESQTCRSKDVDPELAVAARARVAARWGVWGYLELREGCRSASMS